MWLRMLPVVLILAVVLFPSDLNRLHDQRKPIYTPEGAKVTETAALLNDQGVEFYYGGRFEEALGSFIMSSEADPGFAIAHYNCAVVLGTPGFRGDLSEAIRHLERSYELDPDSEFIRDFLIDLTSAAPWRA